MFSIHYIPPPPSVVPLPLGKGGIFCFFLKPLYLFLFNLGNTLFCRTRFHDFPDFRKIASNVVSAVFTSNNCTLYNLIKIFPFVIIQNNSQFSCKPIFCPIFFCMLYIFKALIFFCNQIALYITSFLISKLFYHSLQQISTFLLT